MTLTIRPYRPGDAAVLFDLFIEAVRDGAHDHYTKAQRRAWAPDDTMPAAWADRLDALDTLVAEDGDGLTGFMALTPQGYIDLAYVRPRSMGRGVAQALYDTHLVRARARGVNRLSTHASHLARAFFARNGWRVDHAETVERNGEHLARFAMSLDLEPTV